MKRAVMLLVLILSLVFTGVVFAQDTDMVEDPKENACYAGGDLEGKCDWPTEAEDEWAWECGFYYAGFMNGKFNETPEWCSVLFATIEEGVAPVDLCISMALGSPVKDAIYFHEVKLTGYANQPGNSTVYANPGRVMVDPCDDNFAVNIKSQWMQTADHIEYEEELDMCEVALGTEFVNSFPIEHKTLPGFNFVCFENLT